MTDNNAINGHNRHSDLFFTSNKLSILPRIELKQDIFLENQPILFVQNSKTGGSSINYLIKAISKENGFSPVLVNFHCYGQTTTNIITEGCVGGLQFIKNNIENFDLSNRVETSYIYGHMPLPTGDYFKTDINYISIVRDPLDRVLSLGNYLYQKNYGHESYIEHLLTTKEIDNLQTRALAGEEYMKGECTEDTFQQAIRNIQEVFTMVVPNEEVDIAMALIADHLGHNNIAYSRANLSGMKVFNKENQELCEKIIERNIFDKKIHDYVKQNWQLWKNNNIESIVDNRSKDTKFMVISDSLYQGKEVDYMDLDQINNYGSGQIEQLVGMDQVW